MPDVTNISVKEIRGTTEEGQMKKSFIILTILLVFLLNSGVTFGDPSSSSYDSNDDSQPVNVDYQNGLNAAKNGKYQLAVKHLKRAAESSPNNPDVFNMLGYSHRKLDLLEDAFTYYRKALKLNPRHQGANEYIGELYLRTNNLKKAEEHLDVLDDVCLFGCDEYDDLKESIAKYKKISE